MTRSFLLLSAVLLAASCQQNATKNTQEQKSDSVNIFPVTSFIEGQIHMVDSFQLPTLKYITVNSKTDTSLISLDEFKQLAQEFFHPDVNNPKLAGEYKESNFADQSIKGVTFNYTTDNKDLEVQRVDVVVSASAVANDKVRSIYIERQHVGGDTITHKKLYWRTDKNFQIITTKQVGEQAPLVSVMKVEWNKSE